MPVCFSSTRTKVALSVLGSAIAELKPLKTIAIARAANLHIGRSCGALFLLFFFACLRASFHVRLFHVRLAGPCKNFAPVHDLSEDLAN